MVLLQQASSLSVSAGVNNMMDWPCASSWSWNRLVACAPAMPTSFTLARWSAGMVEFSARFPEFACALVSHPTGISSPT